MSSRQSSASESDVGRLRRRGAGGCLPGCVNLSGEIMCGAIGVRVLYLFIWPISRGWSVERTESCRQE